MADDGSHEAVTRPHPLRGLLLAPLPLVLGVGGLVAGWVATVTVDIPPVSGLPFTPETGLLSHAVAPLPARLAFLGVLLGSVLLVWPFFGWGRSGRAPHRRIAGVLGALWLAMSALLPLLWMLVLQLMREAGSHQLPTLSAGLSESFASTVAPAAGIAGLLAAWLAALALGARWARPGARGAGRWRTGVVLLLATGMVLACAVERLLAGRFFAHVAVGLPPGGWPASVTRAGGQWALAHGATLGLSLLLVLVLLPAALGWKRRVRRAGPLVFVLLLWCAETLVRRAVLHDAAGIQGAVRLTSAGPVRAAPVEPSGVLWPQAGLQVGAEGVRATSGRLMPWSSGRAALEGLFLQEQVERALGSSAHGLPPVLGVTLTEGARAEHLACLVAAARARGLSELVLVGGPPVEVPRGLARAAAFIHPELRALLGPAGPAVTVRLGPADWTPLPGWVVVVPAEGAPFVRARDAAAPPLENGWPVAAQGFGAPGHPRIPVVLAPGAPVAGLWVAARRLGGGTFEVESVPPCTVLQGARD